MKGKKKTKSYLLYGGIGIAVIVVGLFAYAYIKKPAGPGKNIFFQLAAILPYPLGDIGDPQFEQQSQP